MTFQWKIPNDPPDRAALERMKRYFPKPSDLMPEAWFMGWEINYFSWLSETPPDELESRVLADAMNEIACGLIAFPTVVYVKTWRDWFKYLLPYAIEIAHKEPESGHRSVLLATLTAVICVYPQKIDEEYDGFRQDVIYTLGTQIFRLLPLRMSWSWAMPPHSSISLRGDK